MELITLSLFRVFLPVCIVFAFFPYLLPLWRLAVESIKKHKTNDKQKNCLAFRTKIKQFFIIFLEPRFRQSRLLCQ